MFALAVPVAVLGAALLSHGKLGIMFGEFELDLPLISTILLHPGMPWVVGGLAVISTLLTIGIAFIAPGKTTFIWNCVVLLTWCVFLGVYLLAGLLPMVSLINGLS